MLADSPDIQVWLDSQPNAAQTIVTPYVRSTRDMQLNYRMSVVRFGKGGTSRISQGGNVKTDADTATALSHISFGNHVQDECTIELTLLEGEVRIGDYRFDCPM